MPGVFISYRRDDSAGHAGALLRELHGRIGADQVFMDIEDIEAGTAFPAVLRDAVQSCDVLLALMGPRWLDLRDAQGRRRLDDPNDFVRLEIALALQSHARVIPVLLEGAPMPAASALPPDLRALVDRHALQLSNSRWDDDIVRLTDQVREGLFAFGTERAGEGRTPADFTPLVPMGRAVRWIVAAFLGFAVVFGAVGAVLVVQQSRFDSRALLAQAEVVTMIAVTNGDGQTLYRPELAYMTASGESVRAVTGAASRPPAYTVGQRVEVRYDPARPSEPVIDSFGERWFMPLMFGGFGMLFLLIGMVPPAARVWRRRLIRGLLVRGKPVLTAFHAVEEDATLTVNGRHPWRVVTEWRHPVSREMVQFRSPPIWDDPTEQARARMITVLLDPDNFRRYTMDLSFLKEHRKPTPRRL